MRPLIVILKWKLIELPGIPKSFKNYKVRWKSKLECLKILKVGWSASKMLSFCKIVCKHKNYMNMHEVQRLFRKEVQHKQMVLEVVRILKLGLWYSLILHESVSRG